MLRACLLLLACFTIESLAAPTTTQTALHLPAKQWNRRLQGLLHGPSVIRQAIRNGDSTSSKPKPEQAALMVRWLVNSTSWGTLSTHDKATDMPSAGVVSHASGDDGRIFFYLTPMDYSAQDIMADKHSAYTITEMQLLPDNGQGCHGVDPEDPTCARVTLMGKTKPVRKRDLQQALDVIFARHPSMKDWPADHKFTAYEFVVKKARLLDWYGGIKTVSGKEYYNANPEEEPKSVLQAN